jgi:Tfp pilus assembly protein PilO
VYVEPTYYTTLMKTFNNLETWQKAVISVVIIVFFLILIICNVCLICYCKKKREQERKKDQENIHLSIKQDLEKKANASYKENYSAVQQQDNPKTEEMMVKEEQIVVNI